MVEQRKSFPHAVPNSICEREKSKQTRTGTLQSLEKDFFSGRVWRSSSTPPKPGAGKFFSRIGKNTGEVGTYVVAAEVVYRSLRQHAVVWELVSIVQHGSKQFAWSVIREEHECRAARNGSAVEQVDVLFGSSKILSQRIPVPMDGPWRCGCFLPPQHIPVSLTAPQLRPSF